MNAKNWTGWSVRCMVSIIIVFVALQAGMEFLPTWAACTVAVVVCLVLQEAIVLVFAEVKGRRQKEDV